MYLVYSVIFCFFFSSRRRHTRCSRDWSSDVCSSDLWKRVPGRWAMELTAAPLALGYGLGRVGCFLVNDDYGIPTTLPWAMKFPDGLPPTTVANLTQMHVRFPPGADPAEVVAVHPTQIYETALMLLVFLWLWPARGPPAPLRLPVL